MTERDRLLAQMRNSVAAMKVLANRQLFGESEQRRFDLHQQIIETNAALIRLIDEGLVAEENCEAEPCLD